MDESRIEVGPRECPFEVSLISGFVFVLCAFMVVIYTMDQQGTKYLSLTL